MVQYLRSYADDVEPLRKSRTNHTQVSQPCISKTNLIQKENNDETAFQGITYIIEFSCKYAKKV